MTSYRPLTDEEQSIQIPEVLPSSEANFQDFSHDRRIDNIVNTSDSAVLGFKEAVDGDIEVSPFRYVGGDSRFSNKGVVIETDLSVVRPYIHYYSNPTPAVGQGGNITDSPFFVNYPISFAQSFSYNIYTSDDFYPFDDVDQNGDPIFDDEDLKGPKDD